MCCAAATTRNGAPLKRLRLGGLDVVLGRSLKILGHVNRIRSKNFIYATTNSKHFRRFSSPSRRAKIPAAIVARFKVSSEAERLAVAVGNFSNKKAIS
jgi:hypothetical protein